MNITRNRCAIMAWAFAPLLIAYASYMMQRLGLRISHHLLTSYVLDFIYLTALWFGVYCLYPRARVTRFLHIVAITQVYMAITFVFTFIAAAMQHPLIDPLLSHIDRQMGFNWRALDDMVSHIKNARMVLVYFYLTFIPQICILYMFLAWRDHMSRMWELFWLAATSCLACIAIAAYYPAMGAFGYYNVRPDTNYVHIFQLFYEGTVKTISEEYIDGIVCFPSFHAAMAVIYMYVARGSRIALPLLFVNLGLLISTPFIGGHYLADVMAGVLLALILIGLSRFFRHAFGDMERY